MKLLSSLVIAGGVACMTALPAEAHFQLVYTPSANIEKPGDISLLLTFWHPFENGPVMDMGTPETFFVVNRQKKTDLKDRLTPVTFEGAENSAAAFETKVPIRGLGDYVFALVPAPYLETSEDKYIQQVTKSFVNHGGTPTDWDRALDLPTEIVPLVKPTAVLAGSTFTGRVLSEGKPVADAEIEVEFIAAAPDLASHSAGPATTAPTPGGTLVVKTDADGVFTFGIPRAGYWGFAALGTGPAKTFQGKDLSQDAVLWVHADELK